MGSILKEYLKSLYQHWNYVISKYLVLLTSPILTPVSDSDSRIWGIIVDSLPIFVLLEDILVDEDS